MKIRPDTETDTLTLTLREVSVRESVEESSGVILDHAADGRLAGLETLDASRRVTAPTRVALEVVPGPSTSRVAAE